MSIIKVELTATQFFDLYSNSEYLKGLSFEAVQIILEFIELAQEESDDLIDWTAYFMNAAELSKEGFISDYKDEINNLDMTDLLDDFVGGLLTQDELNDALIDELISEVGGAQRLGNGNILVY